MAAKRSSRRRSMLNVGQRQPDWNRECLDDIVDPFDAHKLTLGTVARFIMSVVAIPGVLASRRFPLVGGRRTMVPATTGRLHDRLCIVAHHPLACMHMMPATPQQCVQH